ncbi:MAG: hypothetical protein UX81_C0018G0008 [Parcubacteria group bacterium GW2011_GWA2_47_12]|nr:MAG: hypothetical protein UX81_C0018G0008 [Parcubacteria group bacterium GW2011_GWA2_47_12]
MYTNLQMSTNMNINIKTKNKNKSLFVAIRTYWYHWYIGIIALLPLAVFAAPTNFKELVNLALDHINVALFALLILAWFVVFAKIAGYIGAGGGGDEKKLSALKQTALFGVLGLAALLVYWGAAKIICLSLLGTGNCN